MQRTQIYRLPDDLGTRPTGRRDIVSVENRRTISEEFPCHRENNIETLVSRVRTHLPSAFSRSGATGRRGTSQYIVQTFHIFCARIQSYRSERIGSVARADRQVDG